MRSFLRGVNESLIIDENLEVKVLEIQPDFVRLAITCPDETPSYREETLYLNPPGVDSGLALLESSLP